MVSVRIDLEKFKMPHWLWLQPVLGGVMETLTPAQEEHTLAFLPHHTGNISPADSLETAVNGVFTPWQWSNVVNIDRQPHRSESQLSKYLPVHPCLHWTPAVSSTANVNMVSKLILLHLLGKAHCEEIPGISSCQLSLSWNLLISYSPNTREYLLDWTWVV